MTNKITPIALLSMLILNACASTGETSIATAPKVPAEPAREASVEAHPGSALYVKLPQHIQLSIASAFGERAVQFKVYFQVRSKEAQALVLEHIWDLDKALYTQLAGVDPAHFVTAEGKQLLRDVAQAGVTNYFLSYGHEQVVDKVLFTGFVVAEL